ncbi:ABC transporter ATP-binding protein [Paenibacillus sp. D2_2]|nr:ABC transporter ATP-binding protein [Paenibacillus sp. D2_2]WMT40724.1 ABC transporter ATP-binding protein [Paenibacillus sp. D2_2]
MSTPEGIRAKSSLEDNSATGHIDVSVENETTVQNGSLTSAVMNKGPAFTEVKERLEHWVETVQPHLQSSSPSMLLELKDVSFAYDSGSDTIHDVSLSIREGETVALLGRNGAGKSTLSNLITGLLRPRGGSILYQGEDMTKWSIRRRGEDIGYVMQNPNHMITQHMIKDEIELGLKARRMSPAEREQRIAEVLNICGLYPYRNWPVSALSFGQKKRLSIAAILALQPKLMILDEPTAGQDYRHYTEFMEFIASLSKQGMAFLFITHDMHLALEYADRAAVMAGDGLLPRIP